MISGWRGFVNVQTYPRKAFLRFLDRGPAEQALNMDLQHKRLLLERQRSLLESKLRKDTISMKDVKNIYY